MWPCLLASALILVPAPAENLIAPLPAAALKSTKVFPGEMMALASWRR